MNLQNTKRLIFLDIDGTLLLRDQTTNDPHLPAKIKTLSKKGYIFGLNSNRSLEDVVPIYRLFHLNGPMILENGVYFVQKQKHHFFLIHRYRFNVRSFEIILNRFCKQQDIPAMVKVTDSVAFLRSKKASRIPLLLLCNKYRKFTGSIHPLRYGERDKKLGEKLARFLRRYFKEKGLLITVECSHASGNVIFYPKQASKGIAIKKIRPYYSGYEICMIGDDVGDLSTIKYIDNFFAVGNAQDRVKKLADYVATNQYTRGVSEILDMLDITNDESFSTA